MCSYDPNRKALGREKLARIPIKVEEVPLEQKLKKPEWIKIKLPSSHNVKNLQALLRENSLVTVCEQASCPNLTECFDRGIATFMIMGDKCTRRCTFCDVGHGRPDPLSPEEPKNLAETVRRMGLRFVVITSVDRDDLRDGGSAHFSACIQAIRDLGSSIQVEILVPDFRGRMEKALQALSQSLPDIFNHNVETVPRLYKAVRPGADYAWSLRLLQLFKQKYPGIPTKSGIMVGLGETDEELFAVMEDLRAHQVDMLTVGQYLQPSSYHAPVKRYVHPEQFIAYAELGKKMGFSHVASGPLVRSSYHADQQAHWVATET
eukprot:TRINITY_DN47143_c0_g1_i1.p1 TRINITY_DN47143_c0_g1~~TRINITY_DN47143_c0_g1_i1.p1  ORF type:complete len:319 (+),score=-67.66 TRINITY_DN47143_c0_g1_i1:701-1657(+)